MGGAHEHRLVAHEQVLALDQFDAHLLRQKRVLEVGAVVGAGGQQNHRGVGDADRRDAAQIVEQHVGVVIDRRDAVRGKELRKQAHHHLAVLEHVGDAGGHAQVVLEHVEFAGVIAHDVDAGDVRVDVAGHIDALHLGTVLRVAQNLFRRDHARIQDLLVVVNVVDEGVERAHALLQAALEPHPLFERQHARHDVEGDQPLGAFLLAVDGEGDADAVEQGVGLGALLRQALLRLVAEPLGVSSVVRSGGLSALVHLVIRFGQKTPSS